VPNYLDEYLVKIGAGIDAQSFARAEQIVTRTGNLVLDFFPKFIKKTLEAQGALTSVFAAIGISAVSMADKIAMADQAYRLFGLHMYMSKERAQALKLTLDTLGVSLAEATWDPELNERAVRLMRMQEQMMREMGPDYEQNMRRIRDIRYELKISQLELRYFSMMFLSDFVRLLSGPSGNFLEKLQAWNERFMQRMPELAQTLATKFLPVWKETWEVLKKTGEVIRELGVDFININGALYSLFTGKEGIKADKFGFVALAEALKEDLELLRNFLNLILGIEKWIAEHPKLALFFAGMMGFSGLSFVGSLGGKMLSLLMGGEGGLAGMTGMAGMFGLTRLLPMLTSMIVPAVLSAVLLWVISHPELVHKAYEGVKGIVVQGYTSVANFIKGFEGHAKNGVSVYRDAAGNLTTGYGHLLQPGERAPRTPEEENALLAKDIANVQAAISQMVRVPLNSNQLNALTDFVFNVGSKAFQNSSLLRYLNQGDYERAANEFQKWNKARVHGMMTELPGLTRRRAAEAELFRTPVDWSEQSTRAMSQMVPSTLSAQTDIGPVNIHIHPGSHASPEDIANQVAAKISNMQSRATQRNLQEFQTLGFGYGGAY
jgi:lysozyme